MQKALENVFENSYKRQSKSYCLKNTYVESMRVFVIDDTSIEYIPPATQPDPDDDGILRDDVLVADADGIVGRECLIEPTPPTIAPPPPPPKPPIIGGAVDGWPLN